MSCPRRPFFPAATFIAVLACALSLSGCGVYRPVKASLDTRIEPSGCNAKTGTLLVFLPGAGSDPDEFVTEGFVREVRSRGVAADMMLVDAHLGYYTNRTINDRLEADVFAPARKAGYSAIWLVGISIGGFGTLIHEELTPNTAAGMVILAPYLGARQLSTDIYLEGGLLAWKAPTGPLPLEEMELRLWRMLQGYGAPVTAAGRPPLYLGYGESDRFAFSHRLLAAALPKDRVFTTPGGHDWPEWRRLWQQALAVMPLPLCSARAIAPADAKP